ncbi:unnamed protein product [Paramecium sonneborni]|uniref:Uncharacterized protein n=1 Tax=Paramecium sonneborni TaxID=65129 RepID=A0A8S1R0K9_9CILI|nr:unnamed protein product [Paramecium sonneborni]
MSDYKIHFQFQKTDINKNREKMVLKTVIQLHLINTQLIQYLREYIDKRVKNSYLFLQLLKELKL